MAPIVFPISGLIVALVAVMVVRHQKKTTTGALQQARRIEPPTVSLTKGGEFEHGEWWGEQDVVLKAAWKEWASQNSSLPSLSDQKKLIDPALRTAVANVRRNPTLAAEAELKALFQPILPHQVYKIPFFTREGVHQLRHHLDSIADAGIPTRRPNGMNRYGIIVDPTIEGAVSYPILTKYMKQLVDDLVRPLARMLFPEITSRNHPQDDEEFYAFTIRYRSDLDMALAEHSDASVYTININLNTGNDNDGGSSSEESYEGSSLYFVEEDSTTIAGANADNDTSKQKHVAFQPGMAVLHRGKTRHAALPITQGERHNLVIWLFGRHAYVRIAEYDQMERLSVKERWR